MADFLTYVLSNPGLAMFALLMVIFAITATCILFVGLIFLFNILLDKTKKRRRNPASQERTGCLRSKAS